MTILKNNSIELAMIPTIAIALLDISWDLNKPITENTKAVKDIIPQKSIKKEIKPSIIPVTQRALISVWVFRNISLHTDVLIGVIFIMLCFRFGLAIKISDDTKPICRVII